MGRRRNEISFDVVQSTESEGLSSDWAIFPRGFNPFAGTRSGVVVCNSKWYSQCVVILPHSEFEMNPFIHLLCYFQHFPPTVKPRTVRQSTVGVAGCCPPWC